MKALALAVALVPALAQALEIGVDMNVPVWAGQPNLDAPPALAGRGAPWVRVDFVLDAWDSPNDATLRGGRTWFQAYDEIVDAYVARGVQVYGLIGAAATKAPGTYDSDAWQTGFVQDAVAIVDHFKDRVRVFEIFNEPNNWTPAKVPTLDASPFAHLLARTYRAVKLDRPGDRCAQALTIVSGPVLGLDANDGASFLAETYAAGKASWGWDAMATYPLDGAAYHLYFAQGPAETDASIKAALGAALQAFWSALQAGEGGATGKRIWISEVGWRTSAVSWSQQADFMQSGFEAIAASGKVPLAIWFSLQDFSDHDQWGLYTGPPYDAAHAKPSADRFQALAASYRAAHAAGPDGAGSSVPATLAAGSTAPVTVRMRNLGTASWKAQQTIRLGAGPGCPESAKRNDLPWSAFASGGFASSLTDARAYLGQDVAPGGTVDFGFEVTAPAAPGRYRLAARMVEEGVAWFGSDFERSVEVVAADAGAAGLDAGAAGQDAGADGASGEDARPPADAGATADAGGTVDGGRDLDGGGNGSVGSGCGCQSPGRGAALVVLGAGGLLRPRRR